MADKVTGYGCTFDELEMGQGQLKSLSELRETLDSAMSGAEVLPTDFGSIGIRGSNMLVNGDKICSLDDDGWSKLAKLLKIPTAYLLRLGNDMRAGNVLYWCNAAADKDVTVTYKNDQLLDVSVGKEINEIDVVRMLDDALEGWDVFQVTNQTNSTTLDLVNTVDVYDTERDSYFGGLRVVLQHSFLAPDVSPLFISVNSCAILECDDGLEKLNISGLSVHDILEEVKERVKADVDSLRRRFVRFEENAGKDVKDPRHRVSLYCREHRLPDRVRAYALSSFDDAELETANFEDLIDLFSSLAYADGVKGTSARKLQRLAGYVMANASNETRCHSCASLIVPD